MKKLQEKQLAHMRMYMFKLSRDIDKLISDIKSFPVAKEFKITGDEWLSLGQIINVLDLPWKPILELCEEGDVRHEYRDGKMKINLLSLLEHMGKIYAEYLTKKGIE